MGLLLAVIFYKPDLDLCDDFGADLDTAEIMQYN